MTTAQRPRFPNCCENGLSPCPRELLVISRPSDKTDSYPVFGTPPANEGKQKTYPL